ncbi:DUF2304 domain-containing protein [Psychromicrobium sp. YIM B11713]|uniref:DUF2304 domain-containing protein n=1 Tax=Psychromicrobium sp. YIM B11713 TaxID=3145233 RepID=UPI00374F000A
MGNLAALVLALLIVGVIVQMLRVKKLREKYAVLWLILGIGTAILAAFPGLLGAVSSFVGVQIPSNLLFTIGILLLVGVCLHLSWENSVVEDETRILAEEVAILRAQVEKIDRAHQTSSVETATEENETPSTNPTHLDSVPHDPVNESTPK